MAIGASEAEAFWVDFLRKHNRRGLAVVELVISDAHEGIEAAVARCSAPPGSGAGRTSCPTRSRIDVTALPSGVGQDLDDRPPDFGMIVPDHELDAWEPADKEVKGTRPSQLKGQRQRVKRK